jgi:hypothetical protein
VLGGRLPRRVIGRQLGEVRPPGADPTGAVPAEFSAEMLYEDGISGSFYCSFTAGDQQWACVSGTRGHLQIADFVLPFAGQELTFDILQPNFEINGCDFRMDSRARRVTVAEASHGAESAQEVCLFRNFSAQIRSGKLNPAWPDLAWKTQVVLDACLASARDGGREIEIARE